MAFLTRFVAAFASALALHIRRYELEWAVAFIALASAALSAYLLAAPPRPFPTGAVIVVAEGASASTVARELGSAGLVTFPELLRLTWRLAGGTTIRPGAYRFPRPQNLFTIAHRLSTGNYGIPSVRVTFPEGATVLDMAQKISRALPEIPAYAFISAGEPYEGYLFPDTYSFQPSATALSTVTRMRSTFAEKIAPLAPDIAASGHSLSDIVIMASILEREARTAQDREMVAGVLWNRIKKGMPLQVDAVFGYIYSRQTYSPSYADLGVDSPYNTYHHVGLPPGPISNPGLVSIEAALHPAKTNALFYLTGRDGLMHYATTYKGHKANLQAFLR